MTFNCGDVDRHATAGLEDLFVGVYHVLCLTA